MNTEILDKYPKFRNFFNVSMNYRGDADIRINTFGKVFRVRDHPPPGAELDKIIRRFGQENKHMAAKETKVKSKDMLYSFSLDGIFNPRKVVVPLLLSLFQIANLLVAGKTEGIIKHTLYYLLIITLEGS